MVFLRKVVTASGATAVQVVAKEGRRNRVVKHVGSAHNEAELAVLMEAGRRELVHPGQGELDLGLEGGSVGAGGVTVAKRSGVLWRVLSDACSVLGFGRVVHDEAFKQLVLARIIGLASKLETVRILGELGIKSMHRNAFQAALARCVERDCRSAISRACFTHAARGGDMSLVLYDVTTLYFEAEKEDEAGGKNEGLRRVGYSKERRVDPQITLGLLVDRTGFPLEVAMFEGNKAETATLVPVIEEFARRHRVSDFAVVADAGMLSRGNLKALDAAGLRFIVGARQTKAPHDLQPVLGDGRWDFTDGQLVETVTATHANTRLELGEMADAWKPNERTWRTVWAYSAQRAKRDQITLQAQHERAQAIVDGRRKAKKARFVKPSGQQSSLDQDAFERAWQLAGLKGYVTNIEAETMSANEVVASYHDLWHVEQSFRMSKTDLRARPIFHHKKEAIDAHLTIVMAALAISRHLYKTTGITTKRLVRLLRPIQEHTIIYAGQTITSHDPIPPTTQHLLTKLGH